MSTKAAVEMLSKLQGAAFLKHWGWGWGQVPGGFPWLLELKQHHTLVLGSGYNSKGRRGTLNANGVQAPPSLCTTVISPQLLAQLIVGADPEMKTNPPWWWLGSHCLLCPQFSRPIPFLIQAVQMNSQGWRPLLQGSYSQAGLLSLSPISLETCKHRRT